MIARLGFELGEFTENSFQMAERVGFEPTETRASTVFKTAAIDHSATSPRLLNAMMFKRFQVENYFFIARLCDFRLQWRIKAIFRRFPIFCVDLCVKVRLMIY